MKITLPDGTVIEGTKDEIAPYLPPPPMRNWDGSPAITSYSTATWVAS